VPADAHAADAIEQAALRPVRSAYCLDQSAGRMFGHRGEVICFVSYIDSSGEGWWMERRDDRLVRLGRLEHMNLDFHVEPCSTIRGPAAFFSPISCVG
jgi:hypothetical protein